MVTLSKILACLGSVLVLQYMITPGIPGLEQTTLIKFCLLEKKHDSFEKNEVFKRPNHKNDLRMSTINP